MSDTHDTGFMKSTYQGKMSASQDSLHVADAMRKMNRLEEASGFLRRSVTWPVDMGKKFSNIGSVTAGSIGFLMVTEIKNDLCSPIPKSVNKGANICIGTVDELEKENLVTLLNTLDKRSDIPSCGTRATDESPFDTHPPAGNTRARQHFL
jgi:hypothetical protein